MRAMVYRGPYKVRVEEKDIPPIEHPNDAIVRVTLAAICGSDLRLYHGYTGPGSKAAIMKSETNPANRCRLQPRCTTRRS